MDAVTEAQKIGIRASHAVTYKNDSEGVRLNYQAAHRVMACLRSDDYSAEKLEPSIPEFLKKVSDYEEKSS